MESDFDYQKAFDYYLKIDGDVASMREQYGCFSYDYLGKEKIIRIHFANNDSPLP